MLGFFYFCSMMNIRCFFLIFLSALPLYGQEADEPNANYDYSSVDQLFISLQFNQMALDAELIEHTTFSSVGYTLGVLKDFAVVPSSRFSYAVGLLFNSQDYVSNIHLYYSRELQKYKLSFKQDESYPISNNILTVKSLDFLSEFRFRTIKNYSDNSFFRFYLGLQVGYVLDVNSSYSFSGIQRSETDIVDPINSLRYGMRFTIGYGIVNAFYYHGFSNLFKQSDKLHIQDLNTVSQLSRDQSFGIQIFLL